MNTQHELPKKKTEKKYSYNETLSTCLASSDPDPTSILTLNTTHLKPAGN